MTGQRMTTVAALICAALLAAAAMATAPAARAQDVPRGWIREWPDTDFSRMSVGVDEILSGGPPKDGIPAIDGPEMRPVAKETGLGGREPVMVLELPGQTPRAYPIRYLIWHEIVNDRVDGRAVTVTFCPLCNSAVAFAGKLDGRELDFGVTGKLRNSDMIMYDRQTESWWQQFQGEAIVGAMLGAKLEALPSWTESWDAFRARVPDGLVMAEPTRYARAYGMNPYGGYDSGAPFLYRGDPPPGIDPVARVVRIGDRAWPLARLAAAGEIEEEGVRLVWRAGQASALDARRINEGRDVGGVRAYDAATGDPLIADVIFAFVFQAFEPDGRWMNGD